MSVVKQKFHWFRAELLFGRGLRLWALVSVAAFLLLLAFRVFDPDGMLWRIRCGIGWGLCVGGAFLFLLHVAAGYEKRRVSAWRFDALAGAENRFEAYLELERGDHPLKQEQAEDTEAFYRQFHRRRIPLLFFASVLGIVLCSAGVFLLISESRRAYERSMERIRTDSERVEKEKKDREKKKVLAAESAFLVLVTPDGESRAKPLDELEWEGVGDSPHGFDTLFLSVAVNGDFKKNVPPEEYHGAKGKTRFASFLALEEVDVKPFDLVSCHLTGEGMVGGRKRRIVSEPVFIEIRPFREDVLMLAKHGRIKGLTPENQEILAMLYGLSDAQIRWNKALFACRIYAQKPGIEPSEAAKLLRKISEAQTALSSTLADFLKDPKSRRLPADAVNQLELASEKMTEACRLLFSECSGANVPAGDPASVSQQKAIAHLVQAMKNIITVIDPGSGGNGRGSNNPAREQAKNPFRDKQKFKLPELPPEQNPHRNLSEIAGEQKKLNDELRKNTVDSMKLADRQEKNQERLNAEKEKSGGGATEKLEQAERSMNGALENMRAGKTAAASIYGQKAETNLKQALKQMEKESEASFRDALKDTSEKLDRIADDLKQGKTDRAGGVRELGKLPPDLAEKAMEQHRGGTQENAEMLRHLAERIQDGASAAPDKTLSKEEQNRQFLGEVETLKAVVNAARIGNKDAKTYFRTALDLFREQLKQLKYLAKHPEEDAGELIGEMKDSVEEMREALRRIQEESPGLNRKTSMASLSDAGNVLRRAGKRADVSLVKRMTALETELIHLLALLKPEARTHAYSAEEVPEKYRTAVADYFERLSNSGRKGGR